MDVITLYFQKGHIFLYDVKDWIKLRKIHRIIGEIVGNSAHVPSLPLKLFPEEVVLLVSKNVAEVKQVIHYDYDVSNIQHFENEMLKYQIINYRESRKIQLESVLDKIVAQHRKNNDLRSPNNILEDELQKTQSLSKQNMIWPIFLNKNIKQSDTVLVGIETINSLTNSLKCATFQDLHERGYFVTSGAKFGGDFLVYFGDPICHHAIFIVKCVECEETISTMEVVAFGRLGTSVKKKAVLASIQEGKVCYLTINWIDDWFCILLLC